MMRRSREIGDRIDHRIGRIGNSIGSRGGNRIAHRIGYPPPSASSGFALLAALLALLVLTGVVHTSLMVARFQGFAGRAEARVLQARVAARSAIRLVAAELTRPDLASLLTPDSVLARPVPMGDEMGATLLVRRLAPEWLWIEGEGRAGFGQGEGVRRRAAVFWSLEPARRVEALEATVEVGDSVATSAAATITSLVGGSGDPGYGAGVCNVGGGPSVGPVIPFSGGATRKPPTAPLSVASGPGAGSESVTTGPGPGTWTPEYAASSGLGRLPRLGLLDGWALARILSRRGSSGGGFAAAPGTGSGTSSRTGPDFRVVEGSFTVPPEGFFGLLAVTDDLEVPPGREMVGLVLMGGSLTVRSGARMFGAVRVAGSVAVEGDAAIVGSPCTVLDVLRGLPSLSGLIPAPSGTWINLP